jgi:hypothetical protein
VVTKLALRSAEAATAFARVVARQRSTDPWASPAPASGGLDSGPSLTRSSVS